MWVGPGICISKRLPGDAGAASAQTKVKTGTASGTTSVTWKPREWVVSKAFDHKTLK